MNARTKPRALERFTFTVADPPGPLPHPCEDARKLIAVCEPVVEKVRHAPSEVAINIALLQVLRAYWLCYAEADKTHRNHIGARNGHTCIFQVWRFYTQALYDQLLTVNPPPLRRESRRPAGRPQLYGLTLGEDLGPA